MRPHTLEDLQEKYSTFRRRAEPGCGPADFLAGIINTGVDYERGGPDFDKGGALGTLLIELCCLAQAERLDLAHHARQVYEAMKRDYEAGE